MNVAVLSLIISGLSIATSASSLILSARELRRLRRAA